MPDIKFATADVSAMKLGSTNVSKVMLGTTEVWPGVAQPLPTLISLTPNSGDWALQEYVTVVGTNFAPDSTRLWDETTGIWGLFSGGTTTTFTAFPNSTYLPPDAVVQCYAVCNGLESNRLPFTNTGTITPPTDPAGSMVLASMNENTAHWELATWGENVQDGEWWLIQVDYSDIPYVGAWNSETFYYGDNSVSPLVDDAGGWQVDEASIDMIYTRPTSLMRWDSDYMQWRINVAGTRSPTRSTT